MHFLSSVPSCKWISAAVKHFNDLLLLFVVAVVVTAAAAIGSGGGSSSSSSRVGVVVATGKKIRNQDKVA
jgi:hypothetical protein